jgi:hypothetical protein
MAELYKEFRLGIMFKNKNYELMMEKTKIKDSNLKSVKAYVSKKNLMVKFLGKRNRIDYTLNWQVNFI